MTVKVSRKRFINLRQDNFTEIGIKVCLLYTTYINPAELQVRKKLALLPRTFTKILNPCLLVLGIWTKYDGCQDTERLIHGYKSNLFREGIVPSEIPDIPRKKVNLSALYREGYTYKETFPRFSVFLSSVTREREPAKP